MAGILLILAIIAAGVGLFMLSEATLGVGIIGLALFLGVLTRIAQAQQHHEETMYYLRGGQPPPKRKESTNFNLPTPM